LQIIMAEKLTDRAFIVGAVAQTDLLHIVDVSDNSQDPAGSSFKVTSKDFINSYITDGSEGAMPYWDNTTGKYIPISTSGIFHDVSNNRLGFGINSGLSTKVHIKATTGGALQVDGSSQVGALYVDSNGGMATGTATTDGTAQLLAYTGSRTYVSQFASDTSSVIMTVFRNGNVQVGGFASRDYKLRVISDVNGLTEAQVNVSNLSVLTSAITQQVFTNGNVDAKALFIGQLGTGFSNVAYGNANEAYINVSGADNYLNAHCQLRVYNTTRTATGNVALRVEGGNTAINLPLNVNPTSKLQVVGLPSYADNAAAITGGLTAGAFYIRTGHGLDIVV
jgi:hypothetical protein